MNCIHAMYIDTKVYAFRSWGQLTIFSHLILPYRHVLWILRQAFGGPSRIAFLVQSYKAVCSIGHRHCTERYRNWACRYNFFHLLILIYKYLHLHVYLSNICWLISESLQRAGWCSSLSSASHGIAIPPSGANRGDLPLPRPACPDSWTLPVHGLRLAPVVPASFLPSQELERVHADSAHKQRPWGMA